MWGQVVRTPLFTAWNVAMSRCDSNSNNKNNYSSTLRREVVLAAQAGMFYVCKYLVLRVGALHPLAILLGERER